MAAKINRDERITPFTGFNLYLKMLISVAGNSKERKIWDEFFGSTRMAKREKSDFFWKEMREDLTKAGMEDFLNSRFIKEFNNLFWNEFLKQLEEKDSSMKFANKQDYLKFVVLRNYEKKEEESNDKKE